MAKQMDALASMARKFMADANWRGALRLAADVRRTVSFSSLSYSLVVFDRHCNLVSTDSFPASERVSIDARSLATPRRGASVHHRQRTEHGQGTTNQSTLHTHCHRHSHYVDGT